MGLRAADLGVVLGSVYGQGLHFHAGVRNLGTSPLPSNQTLVKRAGLQILSVLRDPSSVQEASSCPFSGWSFSHPSHRGCNSLGASFCGFSVAGAHSSCLKPSSTRSSLWALNGPWGSQDPNSPAYCSGLASPLRSCLLTPFHAGPGVGDRPSVRLSRPECLCAPFASPPYRWESEGVYATCKHVTKKQVLP